MLLLFSVLLCKGLGIIVMFFVELLKGCLENTDRRP